MICQDEMHPLSSKYFKIMVKKKGGGVLVRNRITKAIVFQRNSERHSHIREFPFFRS